MGFVTPSLDQSIFVLVNRVWRAEVLDVIMPAVSSAAFFLAAGAVLFLPTLRKRPGRQAVCLLVILAAVGLSDAGTNVLKENFRRVRPMNAQVAVNYYEDGMWQVRPADFVKENPSGNSYPSAHAANSMAAAVLAVIFWPGARRFIWIVPFLVGYSRVYLGKHYPADVLGGWLFGVFVAGSVYLIVWWLDRRGRMARRGP